MWAQVIHHYLPTYLPCSKPFIDDFYIQTFLPISFERPMLIRNYPSHYNQDFMVIYFLCDSLPLCEFFYRKIFSLVWVTHIEQWSDNINPWLVLFFHYLLFNSKQEVSLLESQRPHIVTSGQSYVLLTIVYYSSSIVIWA